MNHKDIVIANHVTEKEALTFEKENNMNDPDWTYTAKKHGKRYVIAVFDEEKEFIGYL